MFRWIMEKMFNRDADDTEQTLETGWVYGITFVLVLFLSQSLIIWLFGEVSSISFWIFIIIWSAGISYFLLFGSSATLFNKINHLVDKVVRKKYLHKAQTRVTDIPEFRHISSIINEKQAEVVQDESLTKLENKAHNAGALISKDGLEFISQFGGGADHVLEKVVASAQKIYPRFDGWVVLNKEQVIELFEGKDVNNSIALKKEKEVYLGDTDKGSDVLIPANLPTGTLRSKEAAATGGFLDLLCEGDEQGLFDFMRKMRQGKEEDVRIFMREAILMLDRIHEHRVDGAGFVDQTVLERTRCFSNEEIENIIAILMGSVDYRYDVPEIGVKLSLLRAIEYIQKARKN